jgi:hypothetical protein
MNIGLESDSADRRRDDDWTRQDHRRQDHRTEHKRRDCFHAALTREQAWSGRDAPMMTGRSGANVPIVRVLSMPMRMTPPPAAEGPLRVSPQTVATHMGRLTPSTVQAPQVEATPLRYQNEPSRSLDQSVHDADKLKHETSGSGQIKPDARSTATAEKPDGNGRSHSDQPLEQACSITALPTLALDAARPQCFGGADSRIDSSLLERIVMFASLGHDATGRTQLALGLRLAGQGFVQLAMTALGRGRISLRARLSDANGDSRTELQELVERLRHRGIAVSSLTVAYDNQP